MRGVEARAAVVGVERARGEEQVAVEVLPQRLEKALQRFDVPGLEQRSEVAGAHVRDVPEVPGADDLPVLEVGDEHRLHQQRLRRVGGQPLGAKQFVRLREVVEKNPVHAIFRPEVVGMLLPVAAGFGGVDEVAERKRVGGGVQRARPNRSTDCLDQRRIDDAAILRQQRRAEHAGGRNQNAIRRIAMKGIRQRGQLRRNRR